MTAPMRLSVRIPAAVVVLTFAAWLLATTNVGVTTAAATTQSTSSYAARLTQLVNQARAQHGLHSLTVASGTSSVAASWTSHLAAQRSLSHNPNLVSDVEHHGSANATVIAENVGQGAASDPDGLFRAYMNSPEHRSNILDSQMRYLGIAVAFTGAYSWNTMDFVDVYSSGGSPTPSHAHASAPVHHSGATHRASTTRHVTTPRHKAAAASHPRVVRTAKAPAPAAVHRSAALLRAKDVDVRAVSLSAPAELAAAHQSPGHSMPPVLPGIAATLVLGLLVGHVRLRSQLSSR